MNIKFFRTPKAKKFEYTPRYYDPQKERQADLKRLKKTAMQSDQAKRIVFAREVSYRGKNENRQKLIAAIIRLGIASAAIWAIFSYLNSAL